jgi:hypothetical protein
LASDPEAELAKITSVAQANELLDRSATWLRNNTGEERFIAFR